MVADPEVKVPLIGPDPVTAQDALTQNPKGLLKDLDSPGVKVIVSDNVPVDLTLSSNKLTVQSKVMFSVASSVN